MRLQDMPELGGPLDGGIFAGIITNPDGTVCAVVLLPGKGRDLNWGEAKSWAAEQGGELPSRLVAALLFANVKDRLSSEWHWTSDEGDAYFAWSSNFNNGFQNTSHKSYEDSAVAVRLIPVET